MMQLLRLFGNINELYQHSAEVLKLLKHDGKIDVTEIEMDDYVKIVREILSEEESQLVKTTARKLFRAVL